MAGKTYTEEEKEKIVMAMFPLLLQAVYNAKCTIASELDGSWWQIPDTALKTTLSDCILCLQMLRDIGIFPAIPKNQGDEYLTHISLEDTQGIMQQFNWEKLQQEEHLRAYAIILGKEYVKEELAKKRAELSDKFDWIVETIKISTEFGQNLKSVQTKLEKVLTLLQKLRPVTGKDANLQNAINKIQSILNENFKNLRMSVPQCCKDEETNNK